MKILIIDNYDSFTYNLYQYVGEILSDTLKPFSLEVIRNDEITLEKVKEKKFDRIIISPGPGRPESYEYFGVCGEVIRELGINTPILGVCLGLQGIAHIYGGKIVRARIPMHGKTSTLKHDGKGVFKGLPDNLDVMRYHSLIVEKESLPAQLQITASCTKAIPEEEIMGLRHKEFPVEGIQFHPESFATEAGKNMLKNFLFP